MPLFTKANHPGSDAQAAADTHTHAKVGGGKTPAGHTHPKATVGHTHPGFMAMVKGAKDDPNDADEGTAADTDDDGANMSESIVALEFGEEQSRFAEGTPVPFLTVGSWQFPNDYGEFTVTRDDLTAVKQLFDANARQQTIPIINEAHNPERAIGWITSLDFDGEDRLVATPDWNSIGQELVANDQYRYTSPELLRNWQDPASGTVYPLIASGLAVTNFPRLKALGRIAASEAPAVAAVLAMSERPLRAGTPEQAREALLGNTPTASSSTEVTATDTGVLAMADEPKTAAPEKADTPPAAPAKAPAAPVPVSTETVPAPFIPPTPEGEPDLKPSKADVEIAVPSVGPAKMAENDLLNLLMAEQRKTRTLTERFEASETARLSLSETVNKMVRDKTVGNVRAELDDLKRSGRITPAEIESLCPDDDRAVFLSENHFVLDTYAARPRNAAVPFGEVGTPGNEGASDASGKLLALAEKARQEDPKLTIEIAYAQALATHPELYAEYAAQRGNPNTRTA